MKIYVNAQELEWRGYAIDYNQVVSLSKSDRTGLHTVQYSRGPIANREGTMIPGDSVIVKHGMAFDAVMTDNA